MDIQDVIVNQLKMVSYRGYILSDIEKMLISETDISDLIVEYVNSSFIRFDKNFRYENIQKLTDDFKGEKLSFLTKKYNRADGDKLLVYYISKGSSNTISNSNIIIFKKTIEKDKIKNAILIIDSELSSQADNELKNIQEDVIVKKFMIRELNSCIVEHIDSPTYKLLTEEEAKNKSTELKTPLNKFPVIYSDDPIVKFFGWPNGSLIQIIRDEMVNTPNRFNVIYRYIRRH